MRNPRYLSLFCLAIAAILVVPGARAGLTVSLWFRADVTIDADGRVSDIAWRNYKPMPKEAVRSLEEAVLGWRFRPGTADGVPAQTTTTLTVEVLARENRDDRAFGLWVEQVVTGASLLDQRDENGWQRWERWSMGDRPVGAELVLDVVWHPSGGSVVEVVEYAASTRRKQVREDTEAAARKEIAGWEVRVETVGGRPVTPRFRYVYGHCVIPAWCVGNEPRSLRGLPEVPDGDPVPLDSAVMLLDEVRGTRL